MCKLKCRRHSNNKLDLESLLQQNASEMPNLNLCWTLLRLCPTKLLKVEVDFPSWKVFDATISNNTIPVTSIGYYSFLPKSTTDPTVVREALQICMKSSQKLGLKLCVKLVTLCGFRNLINFLTWNCDSVGFICFWISSVLSESWQEVQDWMSYLLRESYWWSAQQIKSCLVKPTTSRSMPIWEYVKH